MSNAIEISSHVAFFIPDFSGGGAERVVVNLVNAAVSTYRQVDLVVLRSQGPLLPLVSPEAKIVELDASSERTSFISLAKYLRNEKPEWLLSTMTQCNLAAALAVLMSGFQTKLILREANSFFERKKKHSFFRQQFERFRIAVLYRMAHRIVANSAGSARDLEKAMFANGGTVQILENAIDIPELLAQAKEQPVGWPGLVPVNAFVFLASGRLEFAKGFDLLVDAFSPLAGQNSHLIILGEGSQRTSLEAQVKRAGIEAHVHFPGFCKNPYSFMQKASAFVLSSRFEGMPNVLLEAMLLGKPIVATDCPFGPSEMLAGYNAGILVAPNSVEALRIGMETSYRSPAPTVSMEAMHHKHLPKIVLNKLEELYQSEK